MFDVWIGEIELTTLTLILSVVIVLPVQLLLCFKVKPLILRLIPVILFLVLTAVFVVMCLAALGWDKVGYGILAVFAGFPLLLCGIGWGIWGIVNKAKKTQ